MSAQTSSTLLAIATSPICTKHAEATLTLMSQSGLRMHVLEAYLSRNFVWMFLQMVLETKSGLEGAVIGGGHSVAASRLDAQRSVAGWVSEQMGGLSYLFYIRDLVSHSQLVLLQQLCIDLSERHCAVLFAPRKLVRWLPVISQTANIVNRKLYKPQGIFASSAHPI